MTGVIDSGRERSHHLHGRGLRDPLAVIALVCLATVSIVVLAGCGVGTEDDRPVPESEPAVQGEAIEEAADAGSNVADDAIAETSALPKLLDLGADKCVPCKAMAPILEEMRETFAGQLDVEFIDVWKDRDAGRPYNIKLIPTQIFFDADGSELFRHQGFFSREDMLAKWRELGYEFEG